jgi:hypothetical protein
VRVSLRCAVPPSSSYLYYDFPESARVDEGDHYRIRVVAAHGEFVLLEMHHCGSSSFVDHFVYRPAGPRRPPSLSLLPVPDFLTKSESVFPLDVPDLFPIPETVIPPDFNPRIRPSLDSGSIGLLRRGENDLLAVQVKLLDDYHARRQTVEFSVLRPGMRRWELTEPVPILHGEDEGHWRIMLGTLKDVICVGDRFLCWVNYRYDFLLCDMADDAGPKVRYVPLPPEVRRCSYGNDNPMRVGRMGAAGDDSVRFVSIHPHSCIRDHNDLCSRDDSDCWCIVSDRTTLQHPCFVYTIKTWTMNLSMDEPLEWMEDGEMDSEEIFALPGYQGLPQTIPEWPVVCLDKPNVVCFLVSNYYFTKDDEKLWMVQLNINTKTLLSVIQFTDTEDCWYWKKYHHLPAEIQH